MTEKLDNTFKICVVGDSGMGKENFVESLVFSDIVKDVSLTIGVELHDVVLRKVKKEPTEENREFKEPDRDNEDIQ